MVYFLERIAKLLYEEYGDNIRNHCLVFPNRRAGLYFMKYFAARIQKPVWAPAIYTVNEFFNSIHPFRQLQAKFFFLNSIRFTGG